MSTLFVNHLHISIANLKFGAKIKLTVSLCHIYNINISYFTVFFCVI